MQIKQLEKQPNRTIDLSEVWRQKNRENAVAILVSTGNDEGWARRQVSISPSWFIENFSKHHKEYRWYYVNGQVLY